MDRLRGMNPYHHFRQKGASTVVAIIGAFYVILAWLFLRLESPNWQNVRNNASTWFPQVSPTCPHPLDPIRYFSQSLWLILVLQGRKIKLFSTLKQWLSQQRQYYYRWVASLPNKLQNSSIEEKTVTCLQPLDKNKRPVVLIVSSIFAIAIALLCITQPFAWMAQLIFATLLWMVALSVRRIPGRLPTLILIVLSVIISSRYLWWRYTATIYWNDPLSAICGLLLLLAETYAWIVLILGYFQSVWPLHRESVPLPQSEADWPTVDVFITTYNEDLSVVAPSVYAALGLDWPKNKITIYLLDDGNRPEFKAFAEKAGVQYLARPTHENAKAGNLNYALKHSNGELIAIFDCDHITTDSFLKVTLGWFLLDSKLAIMQTPHNFYSADPFERNLQLFRRIPNEDILFYGLLQDGNDTWDATFFCGSCGVFRRSALTEIGGMATETITEDAHTSLRLQRRGYTSAYLRIPLAVGLAAETLADHIAQRMRWAQGMTQIFRLDNPLLGKGLKFAQRLCYANGMLHFLSAIPRLIFLTAPLAFLFLHAFIIYAPVILIMLYAFPHLMHANLTNARVQGQYRYFFWGEIYETALAWYTAGPTLLALFAPHKGKFKVTHKGGLIEKDFIAWRMMRPYLVLLLLSFLGLAVGILRIYDGPTDEITTVLISCLWVVYNIVLLGSALAVTMEMKQLRRAPRVEISMPATISINEQLHPCTLKDYSNEGVGIELSEPNLLQKDDKATILLTRNGKEYAFPCHIMRAFGKNIGLHLDDLTVQQHIDFMQCTFARADTWSKWQEAFPGNNAMEGLRGILRLNYLGYQKLVDEAPRPLHLILKNFNAVISWMGSFFPAPIKESTQISYTETAGVSP